MRKTNRIATALLAGLVGMMVVPGVATAQNQPAQTAPTDPVADAAPLALTVATSPADAAAASLPLGRKANVKLAPQATLHFAATPEKPASNGYGGLVAFTAPQAGTYRLALGAAAWVDVVGANGIVPSTAHAHGAAGSGVRKMIDFPLAAGDYTVQIGGNDSASITVLLTALP